MTPESLAREQAVAAFLQIQIALSMARRAASATGHVQRLDLDPITGTVSARPVFRRPWKGFEEIARVRPDDTDEEHMGLMKKLYTERVNGAALPVDLLRRFAPHLLKDRREADPPPVEEPAPTPAPAAARRRVRDEGQPTLF